MRKITLEIDCDDERCLPPGSRCAYFGAVKFGQVPVCTLFPSDEGSYTELHNTKADGTGFTLRCQECKDHETR